MTIMTIDTIRENPWNAVYGAIPADPDRSLLLIAFRAACYCRDSEREVMDAIKGGHYKPANPFEMPVGKRWWDAVVAGSEISAVYAGDIGFGSLEEEAM